jgi:hypothetical protein
MRAWIVCPLLLTLAAVAGCGRKSTPEVEAARTALQAALDSWKQGEPADRLKARPTPIDFADDERRQGWKLQDYRLGDARPDGELIRCTVALTLLDKRGKKIDKEVVYMVAPKRPVVIARDPYF